MQPRSFFIHMLVVLMNLPLAATNLPAAAQYQPDRGASAPAPAAAARYDTKMGNMDLRSLDALPKSGFGGSYMKRRNPAAARGRQVVTVRSGQPLSRSSNVAGTEFVPRTQGLEFDPAGPRKQLLNRAAENAKSPGSVFKDVGLRTPPSAKTSVKRGALLQSK